jgi:hypothetical protein
VPPADVEIVKGPLLGQPNPSLPPKSSLAERVFVVVLKGYIERLRPVGFVERIRAQRNTVTRLSIGSQDLFLLQLIDAADLSFLRLMESGNALFGLRKPTQ